MIRNHTERDRQREQSRGKRNRTEPSVGQKYEKYNDERVESRARGIRGEGSSSADILRSIFADLQVTGSGWWWYSDTPVLT